MSWAQNEILSQSFLHSQLTRPVAKIRTGSQPGHVAGGGQVLAAGVTVLQVGSYTITACFTPSNTDVAGTSATAQYSVTPASQSISFGPTAAQLVGATIQLNATATSGLAVGFQTLTATVCSVSQTTATMLSPGTCTIEATQSGGVDYNAANPVEVSFPVMGFTLTAQPASETIKRGVLGCSCWRSSQ